MTSNIVIHKNALMLQLPPWLTWYLIAFILLAHWAQMSLIVSFLLLTKIQTLPMQIDL